MTICTPRNGETPPVCVTTSCPQPIQKNFYSILLLSVSFCFLPSYHRVSGRDGGSLRLERSVGVGRGCEGATGCCTPGGRFEEIGALGWICKRTSLSLPRSASRSYLRMRSIVARPLCGIAVVVTGSVNGMGSMRFVQAVSRGGVHNVFSSERANGAINTQKRMPTRTRSVTRMGTTHCGSTCTLSGSRPMTGRTSMYSTTMPGKIFDKVSIPKRIAKASRMRTASDRTGAVRTSDTMVLRSPIPSAMAVTRPTSIPVSRAMPSAMAFVSTSLWSPRTTKEA